MGFFLCDSCHRHVKNTEGACPFCGESTTAAKIAGNPPSRGANVRDRNKLLFGAAIVAVAGAASALGCSSSSTTEPETDAGLAKDAAAADAGIDSSIVAAYGGPPQDSGAGEDSGGVTPAYGGAPAYGAPAYDAGK